MIQMSWLGWKGVAAMVSESAAPALSVGMGEKCSKASRSPQAEM